MTNLEELKPNWVELTPLDDEKSKIVESILSGEAALGQYFPDTKEASAFPEVIWAEVEIEAETDNEQELIEAFVKLGNYVLTHEGIHKTLDGLFNVEVCRAFDNIAGKVPLLQEDIEGWVPNAIQK